MRVRQSQFKYLQTIFGDVKRDPNILREIERGDIGQRQNFAKRLSEAMMPIYNMTEARSLSNRYERPFNGMSHST